MKRKQPVVSRNHSWFRKMDHCTVEINHGSKKFIAQPKLLMVQKKEPLGSLDGLYKRTSAVRKLPIVQKNEPLGC